jgi:anaerobic selenocysteine-containing dehydrogenase
MSQTVYRHCTLCEAQCGLELTVEDNRVVAARGNTDDPMSAGFLCPKGAAIGDLHADPDRLRRPLVRQSNGEFVETTWDEALDRAAVGLDGIRKRFGADSLGCYIGNPIIHNYGALLLRQGLIQAIGTRNCFSAGSQDTSPRFATSWYLYGSSLTIPIPDIDRTDYFLCIGANPAVSNGSALTAPNMKSRMRAIQNRGGKVVMIDPRRSESAAIANEHVPVRPGTDATLLLGMCAVLLDQGKAQIAAIEEIAEGWPEIVLRLSRIRLKDVAAETGIAAETIQRLAIEFVQAKTSAAYSRVGVCNTKQGTLASYATDLLNIVAGRMGQIGGSMFTNPAIDSTRLLALPGGDGHGRWKSRVRGLPETLGDLPAATMAEEMETAGEGQIRALLTFAGNPVLSTPNGKRLDKAIEGLDFMVSVDLYINETTRHADVILPPSWTLTDEYIDVFFPQFTVRNTAAWSAPVIESEPDDRTDWQILLGIAERLGGGPTGFKPLDAALRVARKFGYQWTPMKTIDLILRTGEYGDKYLPWKDGLSVAKLKTMPHGVDLGPLQPGVARRVRHRGGKVHIAPPLIVAGIDVLIDQLANRIADIDRGKVNGELLLIGRRELRSNNSWMHNIPKLVSGKPRCVLYVHPTDAASAGLTEGGIGVMESNTHSAEVPVHITEEMTPGIVSLPHGWGHSASVPWQRTAGANPGISFNDWTDESEVEPLVGQSIMNGIPVELRAAVTHRTPEQETTVGVS